MPPAAAAACGVLQLGSGQRCAGPLACPPMLILAVSANNFTTPWPKLGFWIPSRDAAELAAGISPSRELLAGRCAITACADRAGRIRDFDDLIYPGLPGDLEELVLMCWLHDTDKYNPVGGDKRQVAAAVPSPHATAKSAVLCRLTQALAYPPFWTASAVSALIDGGMQIRSFGQVRLGELVCVVCTSSAMSTMVDGLLRAVSSSSLGV